MKYKVYLPSHGTESCDGYVFESKHEDIKKTCVDACIHLWSNENGYEWLRDGYYIVVSTIDECKKVEFEICVDIEPVFSAHSTKEIS